MPDLLQRQYAWIEIKNPVRARKLAINDAQSGDHVCAFNEALEHWVF
jgi:hypothetical protein